MASSKIKIWQIHYDEDVNSKPALDPRFIPYDNTGKCDTYYENKVILDIWKNKKWQNADYVSVLSWRFKEKTNLTYQKIKEQVKDKDIYLMTPPAYMYFKSPLSKHGFANVGEIAKIADREKMLSFQLYDYDTKYKNKKCVSFCNFFLVKPYIFDDYCKNVLNPVIQWMKSRKNADLRKQLSIPCVHRDGKKYPVHTFFLEGLFQCYVHHSKIPYEYIFDYETKNIIERKKTEGKEYKEFVSLLLS